ncbi:Lrp/AsnC family transcriptional regulator [Microlunatus spumicola]|uniref:Lrp/AsnC family transcriptional regulator n=1 Tax=Microlunatus spumicola TaxID=81499 RepID=A0ABP6XGP7_9ACTN
MPSDSRRTARTTSSSDLLDAANLQILRELQADPRVSMSELARRVRRSPPAVTERVDRLRQAGVIAGWRLEVDAEAVGLPITAYARAKPGPGQLGRLAALAQETPEVTECHRITGDDCFLIKLHVRSMGHLADVLDRFSVHGQLTTSIVVSTPVPLRGVALPVADA